MPFLDLTAMLCFTGGGTLESHRPRIKWVPMFGVSNSGSKWLCNLTCTCLSIMNNVKQHLSASELAFGPEQVRARIIFLSVGCPRGGGRSSSYLFSLKEVEIPTKRLAADTVRQKRQKEFPFKQCTALDKTRREREKSNKNREKAQKTLAGLQQQLPCLTPSRCCSELGLIIGGLFPSWSL